MRFVRLPDASTAPALGLGTWRLGEDGTRRAQEVAALRQAIELGFRLIDTAEMYGQGGAESVVGQAIAGRRDKVYLVSKVLPQNSWVKAARVACEASLRRLGTDYLDLYLLHWRGEVALPEVIEAMERLVSAGKIRRWGVSNFDTADLAELWSIPDGERCATNQVWYSLGQRGIEFELLPWQRARGLPTMAYCPLDEGRLARDPRLAALARRYRLSAAQIALAWLLRQPDVIVLPQSIQAQHLQENLGAARLQLDPADLAELDQLFPPPAYRQPLSMV